MTYKHLNFKSILPSALMAFVAVVSVKAQAADPTDAYSALLALPAAASAPAGPATPAGYKALTDIFLKPNPTAASILEAFGPLDNKVASSVPKQDLKVTAGRASIAGLGQLNITLATFKLPTGEAAINYLVQKPATCIASSEIVSRLRAGGVTLNPFQVPPGFPGDPARVKYLLEARLPDGVMDVNSDANGCLLEIARASHS